MEGTGGGGTVYDDPEVCDLLRKMSDGYLTSESPPAPLESYRPIAAIVAYRCGDYEEAHTQLKALDFRIPSSTVEQLVGIPADEFVARATSAAAGVQ